MKRWEEEMGQGGGECVRKGRERVGQIYRLVERQRQREQEKREQEKRENERDKRERGDTDRER